MIEMTRAKNILTGGAVLIIAGLGAFYLWQRGPEPAPVKSEQPATVLSPGQLRFPTGAPQLASLRITAAEEAPVPLAEPLSGRITYNENVTARVSSPVAGRVISLKAQPGDAVKLGDTLMVLDSPDYAASVADLRKAEADQIRKQQSYERAKTLYEGQVLARKDLELADADLRQSQAETVRTRLRLRNLRADPTEAGQLALRAPLAGIVADRQANPGMEVRPDLQTPLFVVTDPKRLWVLIDLPERNLGKVKVGLPVTVEVDAYPGERFVAVIERVGEVVDATTRRVQVRCAVSNPERRLKPEMYARVTLIADENKKTVRVPNSALVTQGLYAYAFIEIEPGVFQRREVTLSVQDREYSYVAAGIKPRERVVTTGALLLNSELSSGS
jgi:cobalt-zinc-cadmium efflux system membrane fusion protein